MDDVHYAQAKSQLNTRHRWLSKRKLCEYDLLLGIEQKLYGHLVHLGETQPEPDLTEDDNRVLHLCMTVFRSDFDDDPAERAASMLESGIEAWMTDLMEAIDITGAQNWQAILKHLIDQDALTDSARWLLKNRIMEDEPSTPSGYPPTQWKESLPGQIPYGVKNYALDPESLLPQARDDLHTQDRQDDLLWLALGLMASDRQTQAVQLIDSWMAANPQSVSAHCAATVSGASSTLEPLQRAVLEELVPPFWLSVHGDARHLDFCLELLAQPRFNALAERAWYGLTGERLPRVPAVSLGDGRNGKGKRLADVHTARQWLEHNRPAGRLCLGKPVGEHPFRPQLGRFFGEDSWPIALATWVDTRGRALLNPTECHWQRTQRLQEAMA